MTARPIDPESRRRPLQIAVALVLVMMAVLLAAGCVSQQQTDISPAGTMVKTMKVTLPIPTPFPITPISTSAVRTSMSNSVEGKYIFLEQRFNESFVTVSGNCLRGNTDYYCEKTYTVNNSVLRVDADTYGNAPVNESMILFYGLQHYVEGPGGFNCGNNGWFVYSLPGQFSENITIDSVTEDGTVAFHFMDSSVVLKPHERLENISSVRYHFDKFSLGNGEYFPECTEDRMKGHSIYNAGLLDKKTIILNMPK
jgi:hypothetical protein